MDASIGTPIKSTGLMKRAIKSSCKEEALCFHALGKKVKILSIKTWKHCTREESTQKKTVKNKKRGRIFPASFLFPLQ